MEHKKYTFFTRNFTAVVPSAPLDTGGSVSRMDERFKRTVCGWCPTPLPNDDYDAWTQHHRTTHGSDGYSVRHYYDDDPLERLLEQT